MPKIARLGDKVNMHCPHSAMGTITSASDTVYANGMRVARIGDIVTCDKCGITRTITTGSFDIFAEGSLVARVGDISVGTCNNHQDCCPHTTTGIIVEGSNDTFGN